MSAREKMRNFHLGTDPLFQIFIAGMAVLLIGIAMETRVLKWVGFFVAFLFILCWTISAWDQIND